MGKGVSHIETYQVHLVLDGHDTGRDVLCGIANNWDKNETNEILADYAGLDNRIDGVDEEVRAERNHNRR
jgi:hypothetical protein